MREMKKTLSAVLALVMLISLFAFPGGIAFAAENEDELVLLAAQKEGDVKKAMEKVSADKEFVKSSKFSAKWAMDGYGNVSITGFKKDISKYNEFKFTAYANMAAGMYVVFETKDDETSGMDYFAYKVNLKEGWQNISIDLSTLSKTREATWKNIDNISFNSSGWSQTPVPGSVLYFDRISLNHNYKYGDPNATPTPTPTPKPEGEAGVARYYAEDFENIELPNQKYAKDNLVTIEEKGGNRYMKITKAGEKDVHVDTAIKYESRYVVMQGDYATTKYAAGNVALIGAKSPTASFTFVSMTAKGALVSGGKTFGNLNEDGKFSNIAVACDYDNLLYDVYLNGKKVLENMKVSSSKMTYPNLHRIHMAANDDKGANIMVDNVRIFDGKSPDDFEKTIPVNEIATGAFNDMVGKDSPVYDMGKFELNLIDSAKAVCMNVRSGYIHSNGKRYKPDVPAYIKEGRTLLPVRAVSEALGCSVEWDADTRCVTIDSKAKITIDSKEMILPDGSTYTLDVPAEIKEGRTFIPLRALCEKVLGKIVFWDDRGLIVLSDKDLNLTSDNVVSLNSYLFYDRPKAQELKDLFNSVNGNVHPRVILNAADFERLKNDYVTNEYMKEWGNNIIAHAEELLSAKHEEYVIPDGMRLLATCRRVLDKSLYLGIAYKLTGKEAYKNYLWEEMQTVAAFEDWNHHRHYLDVGEMTTAVSICYDWLYDEWTEDQRKLMEEAIYKHGLEWTHKAVYGQCDYSNSFATATSNWNAVCNGGVGVGAIAVFDKYPEACSDLLEKCILGLESMMNQMFPHGGWYEGVTYIRYLTQYLAFFFETTDNAFASDFNFKNTPGFDGIGRYYLDCDGPVGINNFHDAGTEHTTQSEFMWFSKYMNQPEITEMLLYKMDKYSVEGDVQAFMYYDTSCKKTENISLNLDSYYGDTEIASLRSSWIDDNGIYVSMHSGGTTVNHHHLDSGTFVADLGGQRFAHDLGAEDYNAPGYFGSERHHYYRARPEGHNVFVINPDASDGQYSGVFDEFVKFESKSKGSFAVTDLTNAYKTYAESAKRGIMLADERRSILIRDEIRGMPYEKNEVYWFMQLLKTNVEIVDKNTVILEKGGVKAKLQITSDAPDWEIEVTPARPLATSPDPASQNKNGGYTRLIIKFKTGKDININVKMSLLYDKFGDSPIVDKPLDQWQIVDGDLVVLDNPFPEFPKAESIAVNGMKISSFNPELTDVNCILAYGDTKVNSIEVKTDENTEVYEIIYPETLPGVATVTVVDKNDSRLKTTYKVNTRVRAEFELEASGFQEGNEAENCIDGNLETRWAVEGDSYGIFHFGNPKKISSVWVASWKSAQRKLIFEIEVSTDGENFTQVWAGKSSIEKDELEEFKIPEGEYKAIKLVLHGTTTGSWSSILEVDFK